MISRLARIARIITAKLPDHIIKTLAQKYKTDIGVVERVENLLMKSDVLRSQSDLYTEWVLRELQNDPTMNPFLYVPAYTRALLFYASYRKDQRFIDWCLYLKKNPRNIFDFSERELTSIFGDLEQGITPKEAERNEIFNKKIPEGSSLFFDNGEWQVVEVTTPEAACALGRGTKWCTSDRDTAEDYLNDSPLYVIYKDKKKFGQLQLGSYGGYFDFKDLKDVDIPRTEDINEFLDVSGLMGLFLHEFIGWHGGSDIEEYLPQLLGNRRRPNTEKYLLQSPDACLSYALYVIKGAWPEGERSIASNSETAYNYALKVLGRPFRMGERKIADSSRYSFFYAKKVLHDRFPEGEEAISYDARIAYDYARTIIGGRWPEGEGSIMHNPECRKKYLIFLSAIGHQDIVDELEQEYAVA